MTQAEGTGNMATDTAPVRNAGGFEWTQAAVKYLTDNWGIKTTREIGNDLGCSKNSITGKAHRLKLPPQASPIRRVGPATKDFIVRHGYAETSAVAAGAGVARKTVRRVLAEGAPDAAPRRMGRPATRPPRPAAPAVPATAPVALGKGLPLGAQSSQQCSAPLWNDDTPIDDRQVCGEPVAASCRYCAFHASRFLVRPKFAAAAVPAQAAE